MNDARLEAMSDEIERLTLANHRHEKQIEHLEQKIEQVSAERDEFIRVCRQRWQRPHGEAEGQ